MRNQISKRNAHNELSGLNGMVRAAVRAMDKYGPGAGPRARLGCSPDNDAATVRDLTGNMRQLQDLLAKNSEIELGGVITKINDLLACFAAAPNHAARDQHGCDIYNEIIEFRGNMKKLLDGNIYG